jgi:hypothetical protein
MPPAPPTIGPAVKNNSTKGCKRITIRQTQQEETMPGQRSKSIPVSQLSAAVDKAVGTALARNAKFKGASRVPGIVCIPPWIIGFILRDGEIDKATAAELHGVAGEVAKQGSDAAAGRTPAVYSRPGHIILGFVPEPEITLE